MRAFCGTPETSHTVWEVHALARVACPLSPTAPMASNRRRILWLRRLATVASATRRKIDILALRARPISVSASNRSPTWTSTALKHLHPLLRLGRLAAVAGVPHGKVDVLARRTCPIAICTCDRSSLAGSTLAPGHPLLVLLEALLLEPRTRGIWRLASIASVADREVHVATLLATPISVGPCHGWTAATTTATATATRTTSTSPTTTLYQTSYAN
mmetsp:Transcript_14405/g.39573  ORF Transcript_14405/g.39573 Transcript_14405/m.39573 type:complete len:216 (+) Transcript_14405:1204-1851(+)